MVYYKNKPIIFNADIAYNNNNLKTFCYKAKLVAETAAQPSPNNNDGILKNAIIAVPLKCLSNFWRSIETLLINCKVELKLKWRKYCILPTDDANYTNANSNKYTKLYVHAVTLSSRSKLLRKEFERSMYLN